MGMYRYRKCRCEICSAAMRAERSKYRKKSDNSRLMLDFAPLEAWLGLRGYLFDMDNTRLIRWRERGIGVYTVDKICLRHGVHPAQIYGSAFYAGCFDEEFAA